MNKQVMRLLGFWSDIEKTEWEIQVFCFMVYAKHKEKSHLWFSERNKKRLCFDYKDWRVFFIKIKRK